MGLVESFEKEGLVYWSLTEFGERWVNANIEAITGSLREDVKESFWRRNRIPLFASFTILLFSGIRAILASEPTWFLGGIILSLLVYLIIEKIK